MPCLAVFDFDRTIVDADSDATIINKLREKQPPPEWENNSCHDWTPYMSNVFEHAYSAGLHPDDILGCIASMQPTPGMARLLQMLADAGWDILLLTDANSVFVNHWLKAYGFQDIVTGVVTNRAFWERGRLFIEPCMEQRACHRCPSNLCKSLALAQFCAGRTPYEKVMYAGDGRNDFCPATNLPPHGIVFPRRGYPLDDLIKKTLSSPSPQVKAKVVPWDHCDSIIQEIFPARKHTFVEHINA